MKKFLKNALVACSVLSLTASIGLAACSPEEDEGEPQHVHDYTEWAHDDDQHWKTCLDDGEAGEKSDHNFVNGICECGAYGITPETLIGGSNTAFDLSNTVALGFSEAIGSYAFTVNVSAGNSFTFAFGEQTFTVDETHKTFTYTLSKTEKFTLYNPDAELESNKKKATDGEILIVTPANGNTQKTVQITYEDKTQLFGKGGNTLEGLSESLYSALIIDGEVDLTFVFDLAKETDAYTFELCGKSFTADKDHKVVKFTLDPEYAQKGQISRYLAKITPSADSSETVNFTICTPVATTFGFGGEISVTNLQNPEVFALNEGNFTAKINLPEEDEKNGTHKLEAGTYELYLKSFSDVKFKKGEGELVTLSHEDFDGNEYSYEFEITEDDITAGYVEITFSFEDENKSDFYLMASLRNFKDNHTLSLSGDEVAGATTCLARDEVDSKYVYTFTAPEDGWYQIRVYGDFNVKYSLNNGDPVEVSAYLANKKVLELKKDSVTTVELIAGGGNRWDAESSSYVPNDTPVGATISVVKTQPPKTTLDEGKNEITAINDTESVDLTFTSVSGGSYTIMLSNDSDMEAAIYANDGTTRVLGYDLNDYGADYVTKYTFTLAANETITFKFYSLNYNGCSYTVNIGVAVTTTTVSAGDTLTQAGRFEATVQGSLQGTIAVSCTFNPATAGTYKIVSYDDSEYLKITVGGNDIVGYDWNSESYKSEGTFEVTAAGVTLVIDGDGTAGTYTFDIVLVS